MAFVDAYDTKTGKKLPYRVPEDHIDHPVLGARLSRLPSQRKRAQEKPRTPQPVATDPVTTTETPATGDTEKE